MMFDQDPTEPASLQLSAAGELPAGTGKHTHPP